MFKVKAEEKKAIQTEEMARKFRAKERVHQGSQGTAA